MTTESRVALVTAAGGAGIGAAAARRLAHDGFDVVVTDAHERRCHEFADTLAEELGRQVSAYHLDVTDHAQVQAVITEAAAAKGRLDVLVNNAGWSKIEPVAEMSTETWQRCLDVDLTGTFVCMRAALPHMIAAGSGSIINISSIAAWRCRPSTAPRIPLPRPASWHSPVWPPPRMASTGYGSMRSPRPDLQRLPAAGSTRRSSSRTT